METSLRTFCVIPHEARDDDFFDAVFEDGVRALYQGRLHSLSFSHVLSPAHDLTGHVVGPLLAKVRQGGNAALIVALPESDGDEMSSNDGGGVSGEKLEVAIELYAHLLPLLFRSAERCCFARVSVITFTVKDKKVHDMLQRCDVRSEREAQYELIEREGSSTRWGAIMKLLCERHTQLEREDSLPPNSVLIVRVELEGYGKVVLAEVGCGGETLHNLTLLLRSGGACGTKTYPPRGPLSNALRDVTPPAALVHVVGIPDPEPAPCSTMRLLRFMSSMCRAPSVESTERCPSSRGSPMRQQQQQQQGDDGEILPPHPAAQEIDTKLQNTPFLPAQGFQKNYPWGGELFVDPSQCIQLPPSGQSMALTSTWDWGTARPSQQGRNGATRTPCVLPTRSGDSPASGVESQVSREQALVNRVEALDRTNRELSETLSVARAEIRHLQELRHSSQEALRQKQDALLSITASSQKAMEENGDYAKLVPKLLRKVKGLERERDTLRQASKNWEDKANEVQDINQRLQGQLQRLQKEMKLMAKKETQRLREHALTRIGSTERERGSVKRVGKTNSPKKFSNSARSLNLEASTRSRSGRDIQREGLGDLTPSGAIAELRQRNNLLEAELRELRRRKTVIDENMGTDIGNSVAVTGGNQLKLCTTCDTMRHQLHRLKTELDRNLKEKEQLQRLLADRSSTSSHPPTVMRDAVCVVAASLMAGCESIRAQLKYMEAEAQRKRRQDIQLPPGNVFQEHMDAVAALEVAVRDISGRRYRGAENYDSILPTSATAADAELLSNLLLFEVERETRLRAFVPTFAQLSVAAEHLKMRVFPSDS